MFCRIPILPLPNPAVPDPFFKTVVLFQTSEVVYGQFSLLCKKNSVLEEILSHSILLTPRAQFSNKKNMDTYKCLFPTKLSSWGTSHGIYPV